MANAKLAALGAGAALLFGSVAGAASAQAFNFDTAYKAAACGSTVNVPSGSYGAVVINNDPAKASTCVVTFDAAPGTVTAESFKVLATGVNVEEIDSNQTLALSGINITARNMTGSNFFIGGRDIQLIGGDFGGFDACAVSYEDGGRIWLGVSDVLVEDVNIHDVHKGGSCADHPDGIQIWGAHDVVLRDLTMSNLPTLGILMRPGAAGVDRISVHRPPLPAGLRRRWRAL